MASNQEQSRLTKESGKRGKNDSRREAPSGEMKASAPSSDGAGRLSLGERWLLMAQA